MELSKSFLPHKDGLKYQLSGPIQPIPKGSHARVFQDIIPPNDDGTITFNLIDLIQLLTCLKPTSFKKLVAHDYIHYNLLFENDCEIYINYTRASLKSSVKIKNIPMFNSSDVQPTYFTENENYYITFPFCGTIDSYKWNVKAEKASYSFPTEDILKHLFSQKNKQYFAMPDNEALFLINNFTWINFFKASQFRQEHYIPSLNEQLKDTPGFVYIGTQKKILQYNDYQFQNEDYISKDKSFCSFTYIVPEVIDILKLAKNMKDILHHNYIHMQIDCSFKCTRPYVFSVPRVEICHASIPLGLIVTPTEKEKTFNIFFTNLEKVIQIYNHQNPHDPLDFDKQRDVLFLSDQGSAEQSFYNKNNLKHCWCTRHLTGSTGAFTPLAQIETEIFMIKNEDEWKQKRKDFFNRLKQQLLFYLQAPQTKKIKKQIEKIIMFAQNIQLSSNLYQNQEPDKYQVLNEETKRYFPFFRDFSPNTDNSTEGPHFFYNNINMHLTFEHRLVLLIQKVAYESSNKIWIGPITRWIHKFLSSKSNTLQQCSCSTAEYMQGVFGIQFCHHHCPQDLLNQFITLTAINRNLNKFLPEGISLLTIECIDLEEPWMVSSNYISLQLMKPLLKHKFNPQMPIIDHHKIYQEMRNSLITFALKQSIGKEQYKDLITISRYITSILYPYFMPFNLNTEIILIPNRQYSNEEWISMFNNGKIQLLSKLNNTEDENNYSYRVIYKDVFRTLTSHVQITINGCRRK